MAETQEKPDSKFVRIIGFVALILFVAAVFVTTLSLRSDIAALKARVEAVEKQLADGK